MSTRTELRAGQLVGGRYTIERPIGRWQLGTAYAAIEGRSRAPRTLLAMQVRSGALSQYLRWVRMESHQARVLPDALWVPRDGGHISGDTAYMVLERLDGMTLARLVKLEGALDEEKATRIAERLCRLVGRAHAEGVCLGSLRPTNVFLDVDAPGAPSPSVFDVGLARGLGRLLAHPPRPSTRFSAPDAKPEMPSASDDIYSVGALLHYMLTGAKPPVVDASGSRVMTPPSWKRRDSEMAAYIDPVVMKAMAPLARDRYDLAETFADNLRALVEVFRLSPEARLLLGLPENRIGERPTRHTHPHYLHDLLGLPAEPTVEIPVIDDPLGSMED